MAATEQFDKSKKRKHVSSVPKGGEKPYSKKPKPKQVKPKPSKSQAKDSNNPPKPSETQSAKPYLKKPLKPYKTHAAEASGSDKGEPKSKKEARLAAKALADARKKKRKPHFNLEQELASLWEKMRRRNIAKEERSKLISEALQKMSGKIHEIASSHVSSRVLQTCVKYCSQAERDIVFEELRPHLLTLSRNAYAVHLVKKMLDSATKKQLEGFISSLHGHVASLLRHMVGSVVVEHAFHLGNGSQKQGLLLELYSTELQLFKDLTLTNAGRLVDIISKLGLQKSSVVQHMTSVIQPILEKGIVDHSIIHTALVEYFTVADKSSAADVIQQLSGPLLVRIIHTKDGSKVGMVCVKHGSAKERKKIIKGMKDHIGKIAHDQYGSLVLVCILSVVDDTKLLTKIVISELQKMLKELILDRNGRRPLLQLLHPQCPRYFGPNDLASLSLTVPSLNSQGEGAGVSSNAGSDTQTINPVINVEVTTADTDSSEIPSKSIQLAEGGKKDPSLRRYELLVKSGLAKTLIEICLENVGELLRSNFGREVLYEVAIGGSDAILHTLSDELNALHVTIASQAAFPKNDQSEEEHIFENFHSSRTIRKLVLDCPTFAATLWKVALEGKCEMWAQGHSCKVVSAFLESSDSSVRNLAKSELQPLVDRGVLKAPENKHVEKEG